MELAALVGESYSRAYTDIVRAQQCTELMEVVEYTKAQNVVMRLSGRGTGSDSESKLDDEVRRATDKMQLVPPPPPLPCLFFYVDLLLLCSGFLHAAKVTL